MPARNFISPSWKLADNTVQGIFSSIFQPKHCRRIVHLPAGRTPPGGRAAAAGHGYGQRPPGHYVETQQTGEKHWVQTDFAGI